MFSNRNQAGKELARLLKEAVDFDRRRTIILSLPRGGVVIGAVLAALLDLPHQALVIKKISLPDNRELAIGAIGSSQESLFLNQALIKELSINPFRLQKAIRVKQKEIENSQKKLGIENAPDLKNKTVIITDDGAATGATLFSAIKEVKFLGAEKIIVALPVAPKQIVEKLKKEAEQIVVAEQPELFFAVSQFYQDFPQLSWEEVKNLLQLSQSSGL